MLGTCESRRRYLILVTCVISSKVKNGRLFILLLKRMISLIQLFYYLFSRLIFTPPIYLEYIVTDWPELYWLSISIG